MKPTAPPDLNALALARAKQALRLVCAEMPHLSGLAYLVRVRANPYFPVAAVGASGVVCVNPDLFIRIPLVDAAFVLAHELLHLALDTFGREGTADPHLVNIAHDFVINDMLTDEIERNVPLGGLVRHGARKESLEELIVELSKNSKSGRVGVWSRGTRAGRRRKPQPGKSPITEALEKAGLVPPEPDPAAEPDQPRLGGRSPRGDLLTSRQEGVLEPEMSPEQRRKMREEIRKAAAKALSLGALRAKIDETQNPAARRSNRSAANGSLMRSTPRTSLRGSSPCSAGWTPSRRWAAPMRGPLGAAPTGTTSSSAAGCAKGGRCTSCSTPAVRWKTCCRRCWARSDPSATAPAWRRFTFCNATLR